MRQVCRLELDTESSAMPQQPARPNDRQPEGENAPERDRDLQILVEQVLRGTTGAIQPARIPGVPSPASVIYALGHDELANQENHAQDKGD